MNTSQTGECNFSGHDNLADLFPGYLDHLNKITSIYLMLHFFQWQTSFLSAVLICSKLQPKGSVQRVLSLEKSTWNVSQETLTASDAAANLSAIIVQMLWLTTTALWISWPTA